MSRNTEFLNSQHSTTRMRDPWRMFESSDSGTCTLQLNVKVWMQCRSPTFILDVHLACECALRKVEYELGICKNALDDVQMVVRSIVDDSLVLD